MKRRLFLTGPIGCGKSTAIEQALGADMARMGGFRTRRCRGANGHAVSFYLESPDGGVQKTFLDFSSGKPEVDLSVFSSMDLRGRALILDEIGGMELLEPSFSTALESLLKSDTPVIGVMKGEGPAASLVHALGLTREYEEASHRLRQFLKKDPDTLLYECWQFDDTALQLARQWTEEYLHDELF